jgi:uncharacterized protein (TIGR01244 family)
MNLLVLTMLLAAEAPAMVDAAEMPGYVRIRPHVAVAGQPTREALGQLKALGFRTVVNLRRDEEGGPAEEKQVVESQGLRYVSVPVTAASLDGEDAEAVARVLTDPQAGPVLLHCASGNRAAGLWALVEAGKGVPLEDAIAEGTKAGLKGDAMVGAVRRAAEGGALHRIAPIVRQASCSDQEPRAACANLPEPQPR